jgi:hypothetical protein
MTHRQKTKPLSAKTMKNPMSKQAIRKLIRQVKEAQAWLEPKFPDMDPGDLTLILECMFRPWHSGQKFFLRPREDGLHVF